MSSASLVIVNYRSAQDTCACIGSVLDTAAERIEEVVVVDNASGDGSPEAILREYPQVKLIRSADNRGFAAGVNQGVERATGDRLLVLNPDSEVQPGAVQALLDRLERDPALGVTGPMLLDGESRPRLDAYKAWPSLWSLAVALCLPLGHAIIGTRLHPELLTSEQIGRGAPVTRLCGSALAFRRQAWNDAGGMDEGYFMYFEEVEWQRRVAESGWSIAMTPEARVVHLIQGGGGLETVPHAYLRSAFRYHRGRGHSPALIAVVVRAAIAVSLLTLAVCAFVPGLREKSRRMGRGFRGLDALARAEGRR